jgi:hypothetical protein
MGKLSKKARSASARLAVKARWSKLSPAERKEATAPARAARAETIERVGVCLSRLTGGAALFHRVKLKLSRKYRVWPVPGDDRSLLLDPTEFTDRYAAVAIYIPEGQPGRQNLSREGSHGDA